MERAIKIAVENGYKPKGYEKIDLSFPQTREALLRSCGAGHILIDPTFWQSLGKGLGWVEDERRYGTLRWHFEAVRFMQDIMMGKDINSFFEKLLQ